MSHRRVFIKVILLGHLLSWPLNANEETQNLENLEVNGNINLSSNETDSGLNDFINNLFESFYFGELNRENEMQKPKEVINQPPITEETINSEYRNKNEVVYFNDLKNGSKIKIRILDKIYGETEDQFIGKNKSINFKHLSIKMHKCFFSTNYPSEGTLALITVLDNRSQTSIFRGWIFKTLPHISGLNDLRYNFWLLSCIM